MPFPESEADRLNHFLDARVQGRQADPDGLDPALVDAYEQVRAMDARSAPDPQLLTNLWRTMMSALPAESEFEHRPKPAFPALPSLRRRTARPHRTTFGGCVAALGLAALLLASAIGYQRFGNGSDPTRQTTIPAAFQDTGTPTVTGCESPPRPAGSIAGIVESQQTLHPLMPRFGFDPVYGATQDRQNADVRFLLDNSSTDASVTNEIEQALEELVQCRFYAIGGLGRVDMEGRYFALYSDDYIRRELSGYRDAGMELGLVSFWAAHTPPTIIQTRRVEGSDNRVLAILDMPINEPEGTLVISFVEQAGRWLVDEVGFAKFPDDAATPGAGAWVNGSPVFATPVPGEWVHRYPLQLDIAINDADLTATPVGMSSGLDLTECFPLDQGTPVPCGVYIQRMGPYSINEFPANTDFTITLYNLGREPKRVEIADLAISIDLAVGGSKTFVLNADPGQYLFTIFQGDHPDPISAGVFTFIPPDGPPLSMG